MIPCANGTDALQVAFMALDLKPGDEIICPSWTYIATAEAALVLGIKTIFAKYGDTFNRNYSGADWDVKNIFEIVDIIKKINEK